MGNIYSEAAANKEVQPPVAEDVPVDEDVQPVAEAASKNTVAQAVQPVVAKSNTEKIVNTNDNDRKRKTTKPATTTHKENLSAARVLETPSAQTLFKPNMAEVSFTEPIVETVVEEPTTIVEAAPTTAHFTLDLSQLTNLLKYMTIDKPEKPDDDDEEAKDEPKDDEPKEDEVKPKKHKHKKERQRPKRNSKCRPPPRRFAQRHPTHRIGCRRLTHG